MKKTLAGLAIGLTGLVFGTPAAGGADGSGTKYYVAKYDGLSAARSVLRVNDDEVAEINNVLRVKCEGPNTRLNFGFVRPAGLGSMNEFTATRKLPPKGEAKMKGRLHPLGGSGVLRASFVKADGRRCTTGGTRWDANRVTLEKYRSVKDHILNRDRVAP